MNETVINGTVLIAYLITILLSGLVAVAEIFTKFQDEPFSTIKKPPAWLYILFNLTVACITLYILIKTDLFDITTELGWIEAAFTAGLGSTILMRSKLLMTLENGALKLPLWLLPGIKTSLLPRPLRTNWSAEVSKSFVIHTRLDIRQMWI